MFKELFGIKPLNASLAEIKAQYGFGRTEAGVDVTADTALGHCSIWQALDMISGDISRMPFAPYKRLADGGHEIDKKHQAYRYVRRQANERMSAKRFWKRVVFHMLFWNNSYSWIKRNPTNQTISGLYPLLPDRTTYSLEDDLYYSQIGNELEPFKPTEILHFQGLSSPGTVEPSFMKTAREIIAIALAAQKHTAQFFTGNCNPGGILEIPANFKKQAKDNLERGLQKKLSGRSFQTLILGDGAKFHQVQIDAEKAQLTETRLQSMREIASWFKIPASKLNVPDSGGYGSRTEDNRNYYDQTLTDPLEEIAQECNLKLLTKVQNKNDSHFFWHDPSKLLITDRKTQAEVGKIEVEAGFISPNEYREETGRNPRPDGGGDVYLEHNANFKPKESDDSASDSREEGDDEAIDNLVSNEVKAELGRMFDSTSKLVAKRRGTPSRIRNAVKLMSFDASIFDLANKRKVFSNRGLSEELIEGLDCALDSQEKDLWCDLALEYLETMRTELLSRV